MRAFLSAWWRSCLSASNSRLEDCLAALCCAQPDPTEYLQTWLETDEIAAVEHLTAFVLARWPTIWLGQSFNAFMTKKSIPFIRDWLQSEAVLAYLERAFFAHADSPSAADISFAVSVLTPSG